MGPIPWMIEAAAVISAFLQNWDDLVIITALLVTNVIVRSWQEEEASNAIELLKQKLALRAKVLRDGTWTDLPAKELVPGEVCGRGRPDEARALCDNRRRDREPEDIPANDQLRDLSHQRNVPCAALRLALDHRVSALSCHRVDDSPARSPQRLAHHDDGL